MTNRRQPVLISRQPGDGPDGARNEQKPVRESTAGQRGQPPGQGHGDRDSRQVVVAQRRMTDVARKQDFVLAFTWEIELSVGQVAVFQRRVDADVVLRIRQCRGLLGADAKSPGLRVVRGLIRDPVRDAPAACAGAAAAPREEPSFEPGRCSSRHEDWISENRRPGRRSDS